jgi:hypothetical protein
VANLRSRGGGVFDPNCGYGPYTLVIGRSKGMKYGGCGGCVWGEVDTTVAAAGGEALEIARRRGF